MDPVAKMMMTVRTMPAAIEELTMARCAQRQARRCVAVAEATRNMTPKPTATQVPLVITAPRIRLTAASCAAPRTTARAGEYAWGTRKPERTAAVSTIRRPMASRVGPRTGPRLVTSLTRPAYPRAGRGACRLDLGRQQQVGDPQCAEPLAGVVGDQHLMGGEGAAQVDGGCRDGDESAARRLVVCRGNVHPHRRLAQRACVDDGGPGAHRLADGQRCAAVQQPERLAVPFDGHGGHHALHRLLEDFHAHLLVEFTERDLPKFPRRFGGCRLCGCRLLGCRVMACALLESRLRGLQV